MFVNLTKVSWRSGLEHYEPPLMPNSYIWICVSRKTASPKSKTASPKSKTDALPLIKGSLEQNSYLRSLEINEIVHAWNRSMLQSRNSSIREQFCQGMVQSTKRSVRESLRQGIIQAKNSSVEETFSRQKDQPWNRSVKEYFSQAIVQSWNTPVKE